MSATANQFGQWRTGRSWESFGGGPNQNNATHSDGHTETEKRLPWPKRSRAVLSIDAITTQEVTEAGAIASAEAFGTANVSRVEEISAAGAIASAEAFGTASVTRVEEISAAGAIGSAEAFGTASVTRVEEIAAAGAIGSAEAFGSATVELAGAAPSGGWYPDVYPQPRRRSTPITPDDEEIALHLLEDPELAPLGELLLVGMVDG